MQIKVLMIVIEGDLTASLLVKNLISYLLSGFFDFYFVSVKNIYIFLSS